MYKTKTQEIVLKSLEKGADIILSFYMYLIIIIITVFVNIFV